MSVRRGVLLAGTLAALVAAGAHAAEPEPIVIRVGYTAFRSPKAGRDLSTLDSVRTYLNEISVRSLQWKRPVKFDLSVGNYYQIWSWFRTEQIDAAVVSPFMAMLLERDSQALSILEFSEGIQTAGHDPRVAATGPFRDKPVQEYEKYLARLLDAAGKGEPESAEVREAIGKIRKEFRLDLVAHLSSSGFIMPSLYAQSWLNAQKEGRLDEREKSRFWRLFFENAHLTLVHGDEPAAPAPIVTIRFSYEPGDDPEFGPWIPYKIGGLPDNAPSIPNDVLLIRRQLAEDLVDKDTEAVARLDEVFLSPDLQRSFRAKKGKYNEIRWFNPTMHGRFREAVSHLFSHEVKNRELARLNVRWFERGLFDFTIDETMEFLRQDQKNSGVDRLAVVLSGGGVKSLYQTVLLDHLYGLAPGKARRQLRNLDEDSPRSVKITAKGEPLTVHTLIGTSGGAMLAFFASQVPEVGPLQSIVKATSSRQLFPWTDLPRLASILVLLFFVQLVLMGAKTFDWWGYGRLAAEPIQKSVIRGVLAAALLVVLAGAAAIVTTRSEYMESVPIAEGVFYMLTCVIAHFGITCIARADSPRPVRQAGLGRLAILALAFGLQLVAATVIARYWLTPAAESLHRVSLPGLSVLASAGILLVAAALATAAAAGRWGLAVRGLRGWIYAMAAASAATVAAFLPLIVLTLVGHGSLLELTLPYWLRLIAAAILATLALLYLARETGRLGSSLRHLRHGFVELMRDRRGIVTTSLAGTIVRLFAFCVACWGLLVAPAVYSNVKAVQAFSGSLSEDQLWTGRFRTNLVVTGTLLRDASCSLGSNVTEGGLYFCFEGSEDCGSPAGDRWKVFRKPAPARAVDAVFASGSAFPVFPPHLAHLPDGCEVRLVDGGYAHNVPLEAASISAARQVLILNASPDPLDMEAPQQSGWRRFLEGAQLEGGQLVRSSPDVLAFMFARAQELDRNIGGGLVVASLTPQPKDGRWPFLLDFQPDVQQAMLDAAQTDIDQERRIGHVLSWGRPAMQP